jgi:hypothetical protein
MRILIAALIALAAAAPLHGQPSARRLPACIVEASASAGSAMEKRTAASGPVPAQPWRVSSVPARWEVAFKDTSEMVLTATDGDNSIWVVGNDRLPEPRTRQDTLGFWIARARRLPFGGAGGGRAAVAVHLVRHHA